MWVDNTMYTEMPFFVNMFLGAMDYPRIVVASQFSDIFFKLISHIIFRFDLEPSVALTSCDESAHGTTNKCVMMHLLL